MKTAPLGLMLVAFSLSGTPAALAGDTSSAPRVAAPLGVVELFTSQGCSSCPPADEVLAALAREGNVVALSYHVDYWDYLGWKDSLGRPENTQRQRDYARMFAARSVYTPQAVINGRTHVNGSSRTKIDAALDRLTASARGMSVPVTATRTGESLSIAVGDARASGPKSANVLLVFFDRMSPVEIVRGENAGKTISYVNPVTGFHSAGMWTGAAKTYDLPIAEVDKKGAGGCAILLQVTAEDGTPGPIIGAALLAKPAG